MLGLRGFGFSGLGSRVYLEGHRDLGGRVIVRVTRFTIWVTGIINLSTKSP